MDLNTREIAVAVWTIAFLGWALTIAGTRQSMAELLRTITDRQIVLVAILLALYTGTVVLLLQRLGYWDVDLLKETALWFVLSFSILYKSVMNSEQTSLWKSAIFDQLTITAVLTYVVHTYTFPLWVELAHVPALALVVMLDAVSRAKKEQGGISRLTERALLLYGALLLGLALRNAYLNFGEAQLVALIREVLLAPTLGLALIPLLFAFQVYESYEQLWLRLRIGSEKDRRVVRYAKRRLIRHLGLRPLRAKAFLRQHALELMEVQTLEDVDRLFVTQA